MPKKTILKIDKIVKDLKEGNPKLLKEIQSLVLLETEIKGELSKIVQNLSGDMVIDIHEMAEIDNISVNALRHRLHAKSHSYERRKTNGKYLFLFARSSHKIDEILKELKGSFN